ncbi:elongation factor G [Ilumatobacter sp.]|uniref:elongation factor G n=1 Tax=Ilumatobacter sp. TaxID=1967498 RepID=UPI003AF70010
MHAHATESIRNVALVGHGGVGKTTLAEALLHSAGVTSRVGTVEGGTTVLDHDPEETERGSTVTSGIASFDWRTRDQQSYRINLIDTPGHPDFVAELDAALAVADLAIVVVSAVDGIEVGTETAWRKCAERGIPRMVFVTREDKHRADFEGVVAALGAAFGPGFAPLELPVGEAAAFHGVADVLAEEAHEYDADGTRHVEPIPAEDEAHEHEVHDRVVEEIVAGDDDLLEQYLEGTEPSPADLERTLSIEMRDGIEFPVLVGSGTTGVGVDLLGDYICRLGPSPADRPVTVLAGDQPVDVVPDPAEQPLLHVFRTVTDQYVGRISVFRVVTGTLRPDAVLLDVRTGNEERLHGLFHLCGREQTLATQLVAGDIGAVTKLAGATTGTTLSPPGRPVVVPPAPLPDAHLAVALIPVTQSDDDKLPEALQRLVHDDPSLVVEHDPIGQHAVLRAVGDAQLSVSLARLERKYGVSVTTGEVRVPYCRTIERATEVEGRLKKQSGGHGQFAVVDLRVSPLERGAGFEFVDAVVGGAIPKHYISAVRAGIEEAMASGGPSRIPVVDVKVECLDGKTHSVDSSDQAFRIAASTGFLDAVEAGGSLLLEPIARLVVRIPVDVQGEVLGDLSARRGRIVSSETFGDGEQVITAEVPEAEIPRYAMELSAITAGRGRYTVEASHHDVVPEHLVSAALAADD